MAPEIENQSTDEHFFEIVPEGTEESIAEFIKGLEGDFEYPAFTHLSSTPTDEEVANEIVNGTETEEEEDEEDGDTGEQRVEEGTVLPDHVLVNGNQVPLADVQRLYEFDQFLRANPDAAQRVTEAVAIAPIPASTETPPPANQELTPPDFLDMDDPAHKFMWESHVTQQKQLATFQQNELQRAQAEADRRIQSDVEQAVTQWTAAHPNFNEDQIRAVRLHARDMNVVGAIMATTTDPVAAVVRSLDIAAMDDPTLRLTYLDTEHKTPSRKQRSETRKGKLNALGGSSGSVPRTTPATRPMSDRDAIDQFAKELGESFQNQ